MPVTSDTEDLIHCRQWRMTLKTRFIVASDERYWRIDSLLPVTNDTEDVIHWCWNTPSQCNAQRVLFSCSLAPARSDLISRARVIFRPVRAFWGARCLVTWRFQNGGCSFKTQSSSQLSQRFGTVVHTWFSFECYLLLRLMPDCPLTALCQVCQC